MNRVFLLIIDGLGVGAQEDAYLYGDEGSNTLGHVCETAGCNLPNFEKLGIGNITELKGIKSVDQPIASWGKMREISAGKDSTTGHWEIAGIHMETPFPTHIDGFPDDVIKLFCEKTGNKAVLCNRPYSGTDVIADFGEEHMKTGHPIVYNSADSVFQVACHVDVTPVETLYKWCEIARNEVLIGDHAVGRIIARPFTGKPGEFERVSDQRHDYSLVPPKPNMLSELQKNGITTYSIGKVIDLFAGNGFDQFRRTKSNDEGIAQLLNLMSTDIPKSFVFTNLIDTDQIYGHRQDPTGYARCMEDIDRALPAILSKLKEDDLLIITGDHGNDPADDSTDHTREFVPILAVSGGQKAGKALGTRSTFSDIAVSVLDAFGLEKSLPGQSFL